MESFRTDRGRSLLAACLVFLITGFAIADPATKPADGDKKADASSMVKVTKGSLAIRIDDDGVFEPVDAFEVRFKPKVYAGDWTIKFIVPNGATVKAGDPLFEIDDKPIKKEIATATNDLQTATANLAKAQSDSDLVQQADDIATKVAQDDVKNAADALKSFDDLDGPQMLEQGDLSVKNAQYSLDDQNDELDQLKKMYKTEDLTSATADIVIKRSLRQVDLTKIALKQAQDQNGKLKTITYPETRRRLVFTLDQQNNALSQLNAAHAQSAVQRQTALATAKQAQTDAQQKLTDLKADAALFKQSAPFDGVVYYGQFTARAWTNNDPKTLLLGEKVTANTVELTVIKPGKLRVAMDLAEAKFSSVKAGMNATVVAIATSEKMTGKTLAPSPIAKSSGLELLIALPDADPIVTPGMKANISIDAGKADGVLLVPSAAVADSKVWVKGADGSATPRRVITGRVGEDQTEIVDGLHEGDEIFAQAQK